jgi:hypothetical protein
VTHTYGVPTKNEKGDIVTSDSLTSCSGRRKKRAAEQFVSAQIELNSP